MSNPFRFAYDIFGIHLLSNYQLSIPTCEASPNPDIEFIVSNQNSKLHSHAQMVYSSPFLDTNGINHFRLYLQNGHQILNLSSGIEFEFILPRIICTSKNLDHPEIENALLGAVMALWLENHQVLALHASAIEENGRSIVFLSSSMGGKSSLAASFIQAGFPLMSDDIVPVENAEDCFLSRAGYPSMRLWPDEAQFFLGKTQGLETENSRSKKLRIPVGTGLFGKFLSAKRPIACIYLPQRYVHDEASDAICINPVSPRDSLIELIRYSFVARIAQATGLGPKRLHLLEGLAGNTPVRRLVYPSGYQHFPAVREAILRDLQNQPSAEDQR